MIPQRFAQANVEMQAPPGEEGSVHPLWCYRGQYPDGTPVYISAWRPTREELVKLNLGEPVYLHIIGSSLPPSLLTVSDPFAQPESESND